MNAPDPRSRLDEQKSRGVLPAMPPVPLHAVYLLDHWQDVGPTGVGAMGETVLSYGEIHAWCDLTGVELEPWEARLLRHLSGEYLGERAAAADPMRLAPWAQVSAEQKAAAGQRLAQQLNALATVHEQEAARRNARRAKPANLPTTEH